MAISRYFAVARTEARPRHLAARMEAWGGAYPLHGSLGVAPCHRKFME